MIKNDVENPRERMIPRGFLLCIFMNMNILPENLKFINNKKRARWTRGGDSRPALFF